MQLIGEIGFDGRGFYLQIRAAGGRKALETGVCRRKNTAELPSVVAEVVILILDLVANH